MYPETKGVPLEEMDIVFGEGECNRRVKLEALSYTNFSDEREDREENASDDDDDDVLDETSSLLSETTLNGTRRTRRRRKGWFGIFQRRPTRTSDEARG